MIYFMWRSMWSRVYGHLNYFGCQICPRYKYLSNYVKDIYRLDNFEYFKEHPELSWSIDKDFKIKNNRDYYFEALTLMTRSDNTKEANSRRNFSYLHYSEISAKVGKACRKPIIGISKESIILLKYRNQARDFNFNPNMISNVLSKRAKTHRGYRWYYINYKHNKIYRIKEI